MTLTHRDHCIQAARWFLTQTWCDLVCWELHWGRGVLDVVAVTTRPRSLKKRLAICEVKRTRADLLQDLRARKMLKYEKGASHCYLALTAEALGIKNASDTDKQIADLHKRGLPKHWGILLLSTDGRTVTSIRNAQSKTQAHAATLTALITTIAKSFCYRALGGSIPLHDQPTSIGSTEPTE